jgi:SPP1 family predicted phage head-tail adaptor
MNAGKLDRRIDIQRLTSGQSESGAPTEEWENIAERLAAAYYPVRGDEKNAAPQFVASQQVDFNIRWTAALSSLTPKDRIIYPAINEDISPADEITEDRIYDIVEVSEIGRRGGLKIRTARRADA